MSNLQARLKGLRAERGVTQDQVAESVQVSKSLIAAFETSRLAPQQDTAAALDAFSRPATKSRNCPPRPGRTGSRVRVGSGPGGKWRSQR